MAYTVVRTDKLSGTHQAADLVSVRVYNDAGDTKIEVENGVIVELGALDTNEREIYKGKVATSSSDLTKCVLIATPELHYDERKKNLDEFINDTAHPARGYVLRDRNEFSVTKEGFVGGTVPAVGGAVGIGTGGKYDTTKTGFGECIAIEKSGRYTYYVLRIGKTAI